ncbi:MULTISPECIES: hypothetical protein [unclassified Bradyrhizobium]|uniref:hypothetical protein n=1 Tax=unclassified Bradyrhizobium TaxID=2631580 RepID=UPI002478E3CF|nr:MULTISPECIES: hypothetical protein [unclassified Bradyrhizobium]WGS22601.1 hypothetical protein MTX22_13600 [Bradyrhizobium sp. ISRA463]WGS29586.1 hypothetical protein MTX19_11370 [Bradyrhizobium sp. ISRA464]
MRTSTIALLIAGVITAGPTLAQTAAQNHAGATSSPSAQNSGTGIHGAQGSKNGPAPGQSTVGSNSHNQHVQQQDSSKVKGLPGNKSGPPAKR